MYYFNAYNPANLDEVALERQAEKLTEHKKYIIINLLVPRHFENCDL